MTVEKNPLFEKARKIIGETTVSGITNPFDSDFMETNSTVGNILREKNDILEEDENNPIQVFSVSYQ